MKDPSAHFVRSGNGDEAMPRLCQEYSKDAINRVSTGILMLYNGCRDAIYRVSTGILMLYDGCRDAIYRVSAGILMLYDGCRDAIYRVSAGILMLYDGCRDAIYRVSATDNYGCFLKDPSAHFVRSEKQVDRQRHAFADLRYLLLPNLPSQSKFGLTFRRFSCIL
ncbi:MAG: hypothetical protein ABH844_07670 [Candidatus Omnitrophota bacterium]